MYFLKRLIFMVPMLLVISFLAFRLVRVAPGGPFDRERVPASPEVERQLKEKYHLDEPLWMQYLRYLGGLVRDMKGVLLEVGGMADHADFDAAIKPVATDAGVQLAARYLPGTAQLDVGGDWFDALQLPDGKLVSILDVEHALEIVYGVTDVPELEPVARPGAAVFFADDSAVARREIVRVLDGLNVVHQHAANGREAWARLDAMASRAEIEGEPLAERLHLILTDAEMPEMDGYVLARCIKADARFAGIPVVMHSSLSSEANRSMGKSVGVDAYVAKFNPRALADTLRPLIAQPAARAAALPEVTP